MLFAFMKLSTMDSEINRPFRFPGGEVVAKIFASLMIVILGMTIVLFVWVPGYPMDWAYTVPVVVGFILVFIIGEIIIQYKYKALHKKV